MLRTKAHGSSHRLKTTEIIIRRDSTPYTSDSTVACTTNCSSSILKIFLSEVLTGLAVTPPREAALLAAMSIYLCFPPPRCVAASVAVLFGIFDEADNNRRWRRRAPQLMRLRRKLWRSRDHWQSPCLCKCHWSCVLPHIRLHHMLEVNLETRICTGPQPW